MNVPYLGVFRYTHRADVVLMAVGTVAAMANGMAEPLMTVVFSAVIDCFGGGDSSTVLHRITKVWFLSRALKKQNRSYQFG